MAQAGQQQWDQAATSTASSELIPEGMWEEDSVDHYHLREPDLLRFLRAKFGAYHEYYFNIEVGLAVAGSRRMRANETSAWR